MKALILVILTACLFVTGASASAAKAKFPQVLTYSQLMRLAPQDRAKYLNGLREIVEKFEKETAGKISPERKAALDEIKEFIAAYLSVLPEAHAEREDSPIVGSRNAVIPHWDKAQSQWTCAYSGYQFNADVGTCVNVNTKAGAACTGNDVSVNVTARTSSGDYMLRKHCASYDGFHALSKARQEALGQRMGAESLAEALTFKPVEPTEFAKKRGVVPGSEQYKAFQENALAAHVHQTGNTVIGSIPSGIQRKKLENGTPIVIARDQVYDPAKGGAIKAEEAQTQVAGDGTLPASVQSCLPDQNSCPKTKDDYNLARSKYARSRTDNKSGPACIVGGLFSNYDGVPRAGGCLPQRKWGDKSVCQQATINGKTYSSYQQTVCNAILYCKKDSSGKAVPFCVPATGEITKACSEQRDSGADCLTADGAQSRLSDLNTSFQNYCLKDQDFKGLFCNECIMVAQGLARLNASVGADACGTPDAAKPAGTQTDSSTTQ